ncbi:MULTISPECIES: DUF2249 domain-containing protein [unclassified Brachybacterium]|uniref:DUF2249 domain-containing protein n=1 Tax=unclassified Brachybacterium TaxID=2623841 RepID=UPI0040348F93
MTQNLPFPGSSSSASPHGTSGHAEHSGHDHDDAQVPRLDAAAIPHSIRHAAVLGALDSIRPGFSMDLVAPHDPKPLLAQAQARYDAGVDIDYLVSGPDEWVLRLTRKG